MIQEILNIAKDTNKVNETGKTILVVIYGHTLGYIWEGGRSVGILSTHATKGSPWSPFDDAKCIPTDAKDIKLATKADFELFRHCSEGYFGNNEYITGE